MENDIYKEQVEEKYLKVNKKPEFAQVDLPKIRLIIFIVSILIISLCSIVFTSCAKIDGLCFPQLQLKIADEENTKYTQDSILSNIRETFQLFTIFANDFSSEPENPFLKSDLKILPGETVYKFSFANYCRSQNGITRICRKGSMDILKTVISDLGLCLSQFFKDSNPEALSTTLVGLYNRFNEFADKSKSENYTDSVVTSILPLTVLRKMTYLQSFCRTWKNMQILSICWYGVLTLIIGISLCIDRRYIKIVILCFSILAAIIQLSNHALLIVYRKVVAKGVEQLEFVHLSIGSGQYICIIVELLISFVLVGILYSFKQ